MKKVLNLFLISLLIMFSFNVFADHHEGESMEEITETDAPQTATETSFEDYEEDDGIIE